MEGMKPILAIIIVAAVCAVAVTALITMWPQLPERSEAESLRQATDTAKRMHNQALSLIAGPKFKVGQRLPPLYEEIKASEITVLDVTAQNPNALEALEKAESELLAAIKAAPQAELAAKSMAYRVLGGILALKAYYHQCAAANMIHRINTEMSRLDAAIAIQRALMNSAKLLAQKAATSDDDVKQMKTDGESAAAELKEKIQAREQAIAELTKQRDAQVKQALEHEEKSSRLRVRSTIALGSEGMDLLEQALKEKSLSNQATRKAEDLETEIGNANSRLAELKLSAAAAARGIEAAEELLTGRATARQSAKDQLEKTNQAYARERKNMETIALALKGACDDAAEAEGLVNEQYAGALEAMRRSCDFAPPAGQAEALASEGEVLMASVKLPVALDVIRRSVGAAGGRVTELWHDSGLDAPQAAAMQKFAQPADDAKKKAAQNYRRAAEMYQEAASKVDQRLRWTYQGREYQARVGRFRLTGDATDKDRAVQIAQQLAVLRGFPYATDVLKDKP